MLAFLGRGPVGIPLFIVFALVGVAFLPLRAVITRDLERTMSNNFTIKWIAYLDFLHLALTRTVRFMMARMLLLVAVCLTRFLLRKSVTTLFKRC